MKHSISGVVTVALMILVCTLPAGAQEETNASVGESIETAKIHIHQGDWETALTLLKPHAKDSRAVALLFEVSLVLITASQNPQFTKEEQHTFLDHAITSFHSILVANPGLVRVRLELARALFFKEQDALAQREFKRVLAGDIPPQVEVNVQRFLDVIRARRRWSAYGGFALAPDTNIGQASEQRVIEIDFGGIKLPFTRDDPPPTSGVGIRIYGGGEYQHPLNDKTRLRLGAGFTHRGYRSQLYDSTTFRIHAGPRFQVSERTQISLLTTAARRWNAKEHAYDDLGFRIEGRYWPGRRSLITMDLARRERHWTGAQGADRDGPLTDLSLGGRYQATSTLTFNGSVSWGRDWPAHSGLRTRSRAFRFGASQDFSQGITIGINGSLNKLEYDTRRTTADGSRRRDRTTDFSISVTKRDLVIGGFSPRLSIGKARRNSNNVPDDQDYKRTYSDISFVRQF